MWILILIEKNHKFFNQKQELDFMTLSCKTFFVNALNQIQLKFIIWFA
jgi:hypothetical protein